MTTQGGFGKVQKSKKTTKSAAKRVEASKKYDQMKEDGVPEFNIYIRIQGKKNWYPAGSLAVNRVKQINPAIFQSEQELREGAIRLYPILRKHQAQLEYGYRLKGSDFADDPIELAVRPDPVIPNFFQSTISKIQKSISSLLKRS